MTQNKVLKQFTLALLTALSILTAQASDKVRLMHAHFTPYYKNGFDHAELQGAIEVKNIGASKQVWLHYQTSSGQWLNHPAFYVAPTSNGYKAFTFRLPLAGSVSTLKFAVKYEVNGHTYWDNNAEQNYQFDGNTQTYLKHQSITLEDASRRYSNISISARAKSNEITDKVTLVYSADSWTTTMRSELTLNHTVADTHGESGLWSISKYVDYYRLFDFYLEYSSDSITEIDDFYGIGYRLMPFVDGLVNGQALQRCQQVFFRGEPNNWKSLPMSLMDDYTWSILVYFDGTTDFKFDIYNDWSRNFGDNNSDGIAYLNGKNLKTEDIGSTQIIFNTLTSAYQIIPII